MEITGNLVQILTPQSGTSKNGTWKKQEFIIETGDMYPKKVCLAAWGDKIDINKFSPGQSLKVSFDAESREYNGRWYTDLKAFNVQAMQKSEQKAGMEPETSFDNKDDDLPF